MRRHVLPLLIVLLLAGVTACGDGGSGTDAVTGGPIEGLPTIPESQPIDPATETDGVVAVTFVVDDASTDQVIQDLTSALERSGWQRVGELRQVGDSRRGRFTQGGQFLEVSTFPAPGLEEAYRNPVQYSYVLHEQAPAAEAAS